MVAFLCLVLKPRGVEKLFVSVFLQVPACFMFNCRAVERIIFHFGARSDSEADSLSGSGEYGRDHTGKLVLSSRLVVVAALRTC